MTEKALTAIEVAIIICVVFSLIGLGSFFYYEHTKDIQAKIEYQEKYPYAEYIPDERWDRCTVPENIQFGNTTISVVSFPYEFNNERPECHGLYYWVANFNNHHSFSYDSDGIRHYRAEGYDSNGVYHIQGLF